MNSSRIEPLLRRREAAWASAVLAMAAAVGIVFYGFFGVGDPHLGLEAEFRADGTLEVLYVMPVGIGRGAGIKPGDVLLKFEGGEVVGTVSSRKLKNPDSATVQSDGRTWAVSAPDFRALNFIEAEILYGLGVLFVVSGAMALLVRPWDIVSWRLFLFLSFAGLLIILGPIAGKRGGMPPIVAIIGCLTGAMYGGVSWLSSFPYVNMKGDWRAHASRLSLGAASLVFTAAAIVALVFPGYFPAVKYILISYMALGVAVSVAELVYSNRSHVPAPRRAQVRWLGLLFLFTLLPALLLYMFPALMGRERFPSTIPLIGTAFFPIGAVAVLIRYQTATIGETVIDWLIRGGVLYAVFSAGAIACISFFPDLLGLTVTRPCVIAAGTLAAVGAVLVWGGNRIWTRLVYSSQVRPQVSARSDEGRIRNEERRRFLQELHDGPIQTATALMICDQVPDMESMRRELLGRLTKEMRVLMSTSPVEQLSRRLDEAVQQFRQQMERYTNIPVVVTVIGRGHLKDLSPNKAAVLYHVVQEGLSNVSKHSGATEARVRITCSEKSTRVSVEDNGKGFDQSSLQERWDVPHGIPLLKQRIESLGGSLRLGTSVGKGTTVEAKMPHR